MHFRRNNDNDNDNDDDNDEKRDDLPRLPQVSRRPRTVVVVGGGLSGMSTAYFLQKSRKWDSIVVMDAESGPAFGASYANAGALAASHAFPFAAPGKGFKALHRIFRSGLDEVRSLFSFGFGSSSPPMFSDEECKEGRVLPQAPPMEMEWMLGGLIGWGKQFLRACNARQYKSGSRALYGLASFSTDLTLRMDEDLDMSLGVVKGHLSLFSRGEEDEMVRSAQLFTHRTKEFGIRWEQLSAEQAADKEPGLVHLLEKRGIAGALFFPDDAVADSRAYCQKLHDIMLKENAMREDSQVEFMFNTKVTRLGRDENEGRIHSIMYQNKRRSYSLAARSRDLDIMRTKNRTSQSWVDGHGKGKVKRYNEMKAANIPYVIEHLMIADSYVLCTGDLTPKLIRESKLMMPKLQIAPLKGHSWTVALRGSDGEGNDNIDTSNGDDSGMPLGLLNHSISLHCSHTYISVLHSPLRLRITHGTDIGVYGSDVRDDVRMFLKRTFRTMFPNVRVPRNTYMSPTEIYMSVDENSVLKDSSLVWTGHRPVTPDSLPVIGQIPLYDNLFVNAGHGTLGWTLSAGSGCLVSDLVNRVETPCVNPEPFAPRRFYSGTRLFFLRWFRKFHNVMHVGMMHMVGKDYSRLSSGKEHPAFYVEQVAKERQRATASRDDRDDRDDRENLADLDGKREQ